MPKKFLDSFYESSLQKQTINTTPLLVIGAAPHHKLVLKQLNLAIQYEVGPFGALIEGLISVPEDKGLGRAIISKDIWDSSLLDNIDTYSIMILEKNNQMKLFIPSVIVKDITHSEIKTNNNATLKVCGITFGFNPEDVFVDKGLLIKRPIKKRHLRRAETVVKDL